MIETQFEIGDLVCYQSCHKFGWVIEIKPRLVYCIDVMWLDDTGIWSALYACRELVLISRVHSE